MKLLYLAYLDIKRNKLFLLFYIISLSFSVLMLSFVYGQYQSAIVDENYLESLKDRRISSYNVEYSDYNNGSYQINNTEGIKKLNFSGSYSVIERTNQSNYDLPFLYIISDQNTIQQILGDSFEDNTVLIGKKHDENKILEYCATNKISINRMVALEEKAYLLTKYNISCDLNDYIVIYRDLNTLNNKEFSVDEVMFNMISVDADVATLEQIVHTINDFYPLKIKTFNFSKERSEEIKNIIFSSMYYFILFSSSIIIFVLMMIVNNNVLLDNKLSEYSVCLAFGAKKKDVYLRICLYNIITILIAFLFYLSLGKLYGFFIDITEGKILFAGVLFLVVGVWMSIIPIIKLNNKNIFVNMRGDFS